MNGRWKGILKALVLLLLAAVGFMLGWTTGVSVRDDERIEKELGKVRLGEPIELEPVARGNTGKAELAVIEAYLQKFQGDAAEIQDVQAQLDEWEKSGGTPDMAELLLLRLANQRSYQELSQMAALPEKEIRELAEEQEDGEDHSVWIEDWTHLLTKSVPIGEWEETLRGIYEENLTRLKAYGELYDR